MVINTKNGRCRFFQFSNCISAEVLLPISEKLHSSKLAMPTKNWYSFSFCTHSYTTCHDLSTWVCWLKFPLWESRFFAISKIHLRENPLVISGETPLNWSTHRYYKLMEFQIQCSFLHYVTPHVNMAKKKWISRSIIGFYEFSKFSKKIEKNRKNQISQPRVDFYG